MAQGHEGRRGSGMANVYSPPSSPTLASPTTPPSRRTSIASIAEDEVPIVMLETINPMIFVPLDDTLFRPAPIPRDRIERLEVAAKRAEWYSKSMEDNVWHSFRRERDRIYQKLRQANTLRDENAQPPQGILPIEVDFMVHSLNAPAVAGTDFSQPREPVKPRTSTSREWAERNQDHAVVELSAIVDTGALPSFQFVEDHRQKTTGEYRRAIEREKAAEERIGAGGDASDR
ncbi:hypothetical protein F5X68DRAFT_273031 [Plectosphaerella plurivora]|uniref:Uncharacterized protein n=1 Tax=Plectosphaerella plurivora TaxID=936078 RepID=A0A9P8VK90_9PEZI|nr:hypothetical protein F5X68DRAFT_273031 [Plectosphaerella plurivora]